MGYGRLTTPALPPPSRNEFFQREMDKVIKRPVVPLANDRRVPKVRRFTSRIALNRSPNSFSGRL